MGEATRNSNSASAGQGLRDRKAGSRVTPFLVGLIVGIMVAGIGGWLAMPSMMLTTHQSRYGSIEETCTQLQAAIQANGWTSPAVRDMNKSIAAQGFQMNEQIRIVELCNAAYARDILTKNPEVSTLMPCAWGVYKGKDDKVYITGMNMGLMGKMFGGNIARVMGGSVSRDEKRMLKDIIER